MTFLSVSVTPVSRYVYFCVHMHVKTKDKLFSLTVFFCIYIGLSFTKKIVNIFAHCL